MALEDVDPGLLSAMFDDPTLFEDFLEALRPEHPKRDLIPTDSLPLYKYRPLEHSESIRLLQFHKDEDSGQITCFVAEFALSDCPSFQALSYAWGDNKIMYGLLIWDTNVVDVENESGEDDFGSTNFRTQVTENLFNALNRISEEDDTWWWIDALCINQQDNEEKCQQVSIMANIYSQASLVRVWLGEDDEQSTMAYDWATARIDHMIASKKAALERLGEAKFNELEKSVTTASQAFKVMPIEESDTESSEEPDILASQESDITESDITESQEMDEAEPQVFYGTKLQKPDASRKAEWTFLKDQIDAVLATFTARGARKWWERRWVIQEVAKAQKVEVQCGKRIMDWDWILVLVCFIRTTICRDRDFEAAQPKDCRALKEMYRTIANWWGPHLFSKFREDQEGSLRESLIMYLDHKFSSPHDAIYAILSLFQDKGYNIIPDYERAVLDVYIEATGVMINESKYVDVICTRLIPAATAVDGTKSFITDAPSWLPVESEVARPRWLNGYLIGDGVKYFKASGESQLNDDFLMNDRPLLKLNGFIFDTIDTFLPKVVMTDTKCSIAYTSMKESYLRILNCDCDWTPDGEVTTRILPEEYDEYLCVVSELMWGPSAVVPKPDENDYKKIAQRLKQIVLLQETADLVTTVGGRYAWITFEAGTGDQLAIVMGSRVPFALRATETEGRYRFLGAAYVSDVMDGELMKEPDVTAKLTSIVLE